MARHIKEMVPGFDHMIATYGMPHTWTPDLWFLNTWRLICEEILVRVFIDVAVHCPDEALRKEQAAKLGGEDEARRLDDEWPGKGCFHYDWEGLSRMRAAKKESSNG